MANNKMTEGRFLRWQKARRKVAWIKSHLAAGRTVYICTYTRATKLTAKHTDMVRAAKNGVYLQRGKQWVNIDFCKIEAH